MRGSTDIRRHQNAGTRWTLISIIILALVACAIPLYRARAAAPSSGTLSPGDTAPVTWDGTATGGSAPDGEASCTEGQNCDTFTLTLTGQPSNWTGKKVVIKITWLSPSSDYDLYVHKNSNSGPLVDSSGNAATTSEEVTIDPTKSGTGVYSVHVVYFAATAADQYHGEAVVTMPVVAPTPPPATQAAGVKPRYQNHVPTEQQLATGKGTDAGEPSIGSDWKTGRAMFQSLLTTFRVTFNDSCPSTPSSLWEDKSAPTSQNSLDPILVTLNRTGSAPNRTIVSQLSGTTSLSSYTDDDGDTWIPSQGGSGMSGVDHQGIGGGPYHAPVPALAYPNAVYYCSQDVAAANCARSDDGGATYGPAIPIYNINECAGLHGHPKVAPDGTVYVPNSNCISDGLLSYTKQAVIASEDNGATWQIRVIPNSTASASDPSIGIGRSGRVYFGYADDNESKPTVAVSDDRGVTWKNYADVGAIYGLKNAAFPAVVAGDNDRAAMAFYGSTTPGDVNDVAFPGFWHLYIAHTYDGGKTWFTSDATPNDPIQRGGIWLSGGSPIHRNLLDFFDVTVDGKGRVLVGYDDGCYGGTCMQAPDTTTGNSYTQVAVIARQTGGRRLFAAFDPPSNPTVPGAPFLTTYRDGARVRLEWSQSDDGGSPITGYKVYRIALGAEILIKTLGKVTSYEDIVPDKTQLYSYRVVAINAIGQSCGDNTKSAPPLGGACTSYILDIDPTGDQKGAPANQDLDIESVSMSEPAVGTTHKLTFQMKVADLHTLVPNRQWRILWNYPIGPGGAGDTGFGGRYYVGMNTDNTGQVSFEYGIVTNIDASPASTQQPMMLGPADAGSNYTPDGTITIVLSNSKVGNPVKGDLLGTVTGRTFAGNGNATVRSTAAIDQTVPYSTPNFATYLLNGNTCVDLVLDKTQSTATGTVHVNQNLTYTVRVKNRGRTTATNVTMTDTLPASMTFVSATPSQGSCTRAGTIVTCKFGSLVGLSQATVNILVKPQTPGQFRNFATVTSKEADQNPSTNSDYVTTRVVK